MLQNAYRDAKKMDSSLSLMIAIWIWAILSAFAVIGSGALSVFFLIDEEWHGTGLALLCFLGSLGFLYFSILILGQPAAAVWAWRVLAALATCFGVLSCVLVLRTGYGELTEILSVLGSTALAAVMVTLAVFVASKPALLYPGPHLCLAVTISFPRLKSGIPLP
jgi:hypothetical protein